MRKKIFLVVALSFGCSHHYPSVETPLAAQQCDLALKKIDNPTQKMTRHVETLAKNIVAYSYIFSSYSAELLWDASTGTILIVSLCAPTIALLAMMSNNASKGANMGSMQGLGCIGTDEGFKKMYSALRAPPMGRQATLQTEEWRMDCPNTRELTTVISKVADCYEKNGDPASLEKASISLTNVTSSLSFFYCLPEADRVAIWNQQARLREKSSAL